MKSVIVTGANGFVGRYLLRYLSDLGYFTYAIVRNEAEDISSIEEIPNVEIVYCDLECISELPQLIEQRDIIAAYHLAWAGSSGILRENYLLQLKNIEWTCDFITAIGKMKINRVIISGSVVQLMFRDYLTEDQITPDMKTCYAIGKIASEYFCKCLSVKFGINVCWAYITNFYGIDDPTNNFINFLIEHYLEKKVPILSSAEQLADFTYVTDIAKGLFYACEKGKPNTSYYIGYGKPRPLKYFINIVKDSIDPKIESGIGISTFNGRDVDFEKVDVYRDTGYKAEVSFEDGIKRLIDYRCNRKK